MEELFKDEAYVTAEMGRIVQQTKRPDNSKSDWEVIFKTLGFALVHVAHNQLGIVHWAMNEAQVRHSFFLERNGMGLASFRPLF